MARPRKFNVSEAWEYKKKYDYTYGEIAQHFGVCESTVKKAFLAYQRDIPQVARTRVMVKKSLIVCLILVITIAVQKKWPNANLGIVLFLIPTVLTTSVG